MTSENDRKPVWVYHWLGWTGVLILLDQTSKALIRTHLLPGSRLPLIGEILFITYTPNYRGVSWFVPDLPAWILSLILILRLLVMLMAFPVYDFYSRYYRTSSFALLASILISAGIAGNLLDGAFTPFTTDFIQVFQSPSANFADLFSMAGLCALSIEFDLQWKHIKSNWRGVRHSHAQQIQVMNAFINHLKMYFVRKA
jgi:lipoprotein signal peptidase